MRVLRAARPSAAGLAAAVAVGAAIALAGCSAGPPPAPPASVGASVDHAVPAALRDLPLVDAAGQPRPLSAFSGKILVVSDMMTLCQETCPLDTASVVQLARAVEDAGLGDKVEFASVTIDPTRDTPAQLAAYRALFAPAPADWTVLTGPANAVATLWRTLGVYIEKVPSDRPPPKNWRTGQTLAYDLDHSDEVFFLDGDFHERFVLDGVPHIAQSSAVPAPLRAFMDADGRRNLADPPGTAWTVAQAESVLSWLVGTPL